MDFRENREAPGYIQERFNTDPGLPLTFKYRLTVATKHYKILSENLALLKNQGAGLFHIQYIPITTGDHYS